VPTCVDVSSERICQWLLLNAPEYRTQLSHVWLWDEWPRRWAADAGIDLVAETVLGDLWAVQAKAYDPAYTIKKSDIDSFLSESARPQFSYRLLVATTDRVGQTARRTIAGQEKPAGVLLRSQLALVEVAWPASPAVLRPQPARRKRPRPHQRQAVAAIVPGFRSHDRGQLLMACGTGKTLVGAFVAQALGARRVLVLVPSLSLLGQTLREWAAAIDFDYLAVCSDQTVTMDEQDAVVASTSELGIPVTTDSGRIGRFLRRRGDRVKVVLGTYQSSPQIASAQTSRVPVFDLVIADEAHRCAGPQAGVFATVLDPTRIKARKRLFMTATPRYFTGRVKREAAEADWEVASMDDEKRFGPVLHRLSFGAAIDRDLLSDYQVVVVGVTDRHYLEMAERGAFVTRDGETVTDARTLAREIGLLRAMATHDLNRVVTFHSRIDSASRFASSLLDTNTWLPTRRRPSGRLWADHVSGRMTAGERDARLRRLRTVRGGERGVLTNARCLNEGVDVPTLDGVAFIDSRRSQIDVVQAVGRAIRKAEDKTIGTIVIPVLVDEFVDPEQALESSEFDRVWQVVRALRDHDEDLAEELDEIRRGLGLRRTVGERPAKIVLDLPIGVDQTFTRAFDSLLVETATRRWEFMFGLLERYVARFGNARPPSVYEEDGFKLGLWVGTQRSRRKVLAAEKQERLAALPGWVWNVRSEGWRESYERLQEFARREGHASPPQLWKESGFPIGQWVAKQRNSAAAGNLKEERRRLLEALPGWAWNVRDAAWERAFKALREFAEQEGHASPERSCRRNGIGLGQWVWNQRIRAERLSSDQRYRLDLLPGWSWGLLETKWEEGFEAMAQYTKREGHAPPQRNIWRTPFRLGDGSTSSAIATEAGS
jgi:superfamily II DNA or RNA helicase